MEITVHFIWAAAVVLVVAIVGAVWGAAGLFGQHSIRYVCSNSLIDRDPYAYQHVAECIWFSSHGEWPKNEPPH